MTWCESIKSSQTWYQSKLNSVFFIIFSAPVFLLSVISEQNVRFSIVLQPNGRFTLQKGIKVDDVVPNSKRFSLSFFLFWLSFPFFGWRLFSHLHNLCLLSRINAFRRVFVSFPLDCERYTQSEKERADNGTHNRIRLNRNYPFSKEYFFVVGVTMLKLLHFISMHFDSGSMLIKSSTSWNQNISTKFT